MVTVESDIQWNARRVEKDGVELFVLVPAEATDKKELPMDVFLYNSSQRQLYVAETGYLPDGHLTLQMQGGDSVPYTRMGRNLFVDGPRPGYVIRTIAPGEFWHWQFNFSQAFEPLEPGNYKLSLDATVTLLDSKAIESSDLSKGTEMKLVAKDIPVAVR